MRKKRKGLISTIILVIALLVGLSVMLYPSFSDWWNKRAAAGVISSYDDAVAKIDENVKVDLFAEAEAFNARLAEMYAPFSSTKDLTDYDSILDVAGTGVIGYVTVPVIGVELPVYHGTESEVLNIAVGHLKGSSFPVGGASTHAVLSAHRGLPSARLFTDLDELVVGDIFTVTVLDRICTYEVEEINIVLPKEMDKLAIVPEKDYVTLMTCTPYGVNTHRLLVRAHRIETIYERTVLVSADAVQVDPLLVVPAIAAPLLVALMIFWARNGKKKSNKLPLGDPLSVLEWKAGD